ncbi:hypothetical protein EI94DRAFT_370180 [Lactarius quietus]|nr:hypothetical protein EI94DRAFT_370180 [Lactarius quietus]
MSRAPPEGVSVTKANIVPGTGNDCPRHSHLSLTPPQVTTRSSILNSVSSSRSIPAKNVLVLGQPQPSTGKSTLVSALLQRPPVDARKDEPRTDFALGYDWADIRDEVDPHERVPNHYASDILARLSVYTVPSSAPSYTTSYRIPYSRNPLFLTPPS